MMLNKLNYATLTVIDIDVKSCQIMLDKILNNGPIVKYKISINTIETDKIYVGNPLYNGMIKILIWEPKYIPGKTAFFCNIIDGYATLVYKLCSRNRLSCISVDFTNTKYTKDDRPSFFFRYYNFTDNKNIDRFIYAIKESHKWVFYEKGEVQPFEDISNYQNKIKPKRINKEIILGYLRNVNIDIEDDNFWDSKDGKGVYFKQIIQNE